MQEYNRLAQTNLIDIEPVPKPYHALVPQSLTLQRHFSGKLLFLVSRCISKQDSASPDPTPRDTQYAKSRLSTWITQLFLFYQSI